MVSDTIRADERIQIIRFVCHFGRCRRLGSTEFAKLRRASAVNRGDSDCGEAVTRGTLGIGDTEAIRVAGERLVKG
jgi:hypothetical protein